MIETTIKTLAITSNILFLVFSLIFPIVYISKTSKFLKSVIVFWVSCVLFLFLICVVIPGLLSILLPDYKQYIHETFPEETGVGVFVLGGWLTCAIYCGIIYGTHRIFNRRPSKKTKETVIITKP